MFSSRVSTPLTDDPTTEDIFESALSTLFTDVTQNSHGTPGASVTYHSPRFGPISLRIPTHPDIEDGRKLFAHYLWNAGVIAADAIEVASVSDDAGGGSGPAEDGRAKSRAHIQDGTHGEGLEKAEYETKATMIVDWDRRFWNVRGKRVLELGAATALPSLVSALSGALTVTITDHPSSPALIMGAVEQNVRDNVTNRNKNNNNSAKTPSDITATTATTTTTTANIQVLGYAWGTETMYAPQSHGKPTLPDSQPQPGTYDRIIVADCLWMPSQHRNIVKTILRYLVLGNDRPGSGEEQPSCALVVAGFHTGRGIVRNFFGIATGEWGESDNEEEQEDDDEEDPELAEVSGKLKTLEMFEVDVDGNKRPWKSTRQGETKDSAKRWCVCAVLGRR